MTWQILIGLSVTLYSISVLIQRLILKEDKSQPVAFSIFFQLVCGVLVGFFGFLFSDMSLPKDLKTLLFNLLLGILLYGFGNVFIFQALKRTEASKFTIIFAMKAFFTVLASSFILREFLSFQQIIGALLIFSGIVFVNFKSAKLSFGKGEFLALLGAASFGLVNTNDRYLLKSFNLYPFLTLIFILPAIFILGIYPKELKQMKLFLQKNILWKILGLCLIYTASAITFFAALQTSHNSSQVATVNLTSVIITVLLAVTLLKERKNLVQKLAGAILTFAGLLLVS